MLSGIIFLALYAYFTLHATQSYATLDVFSPTRTFVVSILCAPLVSIALPCMALFRFAMLIKHKLAPNPFWDSILLIALLYFIAFLVLGMGSFHYFMPPSILACLYAIFFLHNYGALLAKNCLFWCINTLICFIFITNTIPQGIHYFSLNKIQMRNFEQTMSFLAFYLKDNPHTTLYFDGFGRGGDKYYNAWAYRAIFNILPTFYNVQDFDIKSKEPNGQKFVPNPDEQLSFFKNDEVNEPQSGDIIILTFFSDKPITQAYIDSLKQQYQLLFVTHNIGYLPSYNLMSLGAYFLQQQGISHALSNVGNIFKLPKQMYVFKVP